MRNKAFTLIELLVVIAIVGILSSVIYTNITGLRDRAKITAGIRFDSSTLHSIGDQLVGEWLFNEASTTGALDTSGYGNNGVYSATTWPTYQATGGYNGKGAYSFNGLNSPYDYIGLGNVALFDLTTITISVWVKATEPSTYAGSYTPIIAKYSSNAGYDLYIKNSNGLLSWTVRGTSGINFDTTKGSSLFDNQWHHIAATGNATEVNLYLDGAFLDKKTGTWTPTFATDQLRIGTRSAGYNYFNGLIDDIRIYSSVLSSSGIQKLYTEGVSSHSNLANK
jgi:prepilin-type N-terminal cleavage/methylation domain-containing protein